jgi:hypothetical protein
MEHYKVKTTNYAKITFNEINSFLKLNSPGKYFLTLKDDNFHLDDEEVFYKSLRKLFLKCLMTNSVINLELTANNIPIYMYLFQRLGINSLWLKSNIKIYLSVDNLAKIDINKIFSYGLLCPLYLPHRYLYQIPFETLKKYRDLIKCSDLPFINEKYNGENVMISFYPMLDDFMERFTEHYNLDDLDDLMKARIIFKYINHNIKYDHLAYRISFLPNSDYFTKPSQIPSLVMRKKRGMCLGESFLFEGLLNNGYMKVNAQAVGGTYAINGQGHEWVNFLIDGKVYEGCLTMKRFGSNLRKEGYLYAPDEKVVTYPYQTLTPTKVHQLDEKIIKCHKK